MSWDATGIDELRTAVDYEPSDCFHRCNLASALAASGAVDEALRQLAVAAANAHSQLSAGCVASAVREIADGFAVSWSLPTLLPLPPRAFRLGPAVHRMSA
jgi:hypothetical protein